MRSWAHAHTLSHDSPHLLPHAACCRAAACVRGRLGARWQLDRTAAALQALAGRLVARAQGQQIPPLIVHAPSGSDPRSPGGCPSSFAVLQAPSHHARHHRRHHLSRRPLPAGICPCEPVPHASGEAHVPPPTLSCPSSIPRARRAASSIVPPSSESSPAAMGSLEASPMCRSPPTQGT